MFKFEGIMLKYTRFYSHGACYIHELQTKSELLLKDAKSQNRMD